MLIDTHCHINMLVKDDFDSYLTQKQIENAHIIVEESTRCGVTKIVNVGTSFIESINCISLAQKYKNLYATIGIHPNDGTNNWQREIAQFKILLKEKIEKKIVGIGECGIDMYRPGYDLKLQQDLFKAQIELALENNLALVVHSRNAADETLTILEQYKNDITRAVLHCFSYDLAIAQQAVSWGLYLGIDAPITYPKNVELRTIVKTLPLSAMVLETDAPFLPPQELRGKKNHPKHIVDIAQRIADERSESFELVAQETTKNASRLFALGKYE